MVVTVIGVLFVIVLGVFWLIDYYDFQPPSKCTGDCNQGRNCTCYDK